jgi:hypothetical protein
MGPCGGAPLPLISITPLIINWECGPSPCRDCAISVLVDKRDKSKNNCIFFIMYGLE